MGQRHAGDSSREDRDKWKQTEESNEQVECFRHCYRGRELQIQLTWANSKDMDRQQEWDSGKEVMSQVTYHWKQHCVALDTTRGPQPWLSWRVKWETVSTRVSWWGPSGVTVHHFFESVRMYIYVTGLLLLSCLWNPGEQGWNRGQDHHTNVHGLVMQFMRKELRHPPFSFSTTNLLLSPTF